MRSGWVDRSTKACPLLTVHIPSPLRHPDGSQNKQDEAGLPACSPPGVPGPRHGLHRLQQHLFLAAAQQVPVLQVRLDAGGSGFQRHPPLPLGQHPLDQREYTSAQMHASVANRPSGLVVAPASRPPPSPLRRPSAAAPTLPAAAAKRSTYCWQGKVYRCANNDYVCFREGPCKAIKREPKLTGAALGLALPCR